MPKNTYFIVFILILGSILLLPACSRKDTRTEIKASVKAPKPVVPDSGKGIESVVITFSGSAARLELIGKDVTDKATLSPGYAGKWIMESDTKLSFTPEKDWPLGEDFTITLDKSLFTSKIRLNKYKLTFSLPSLKANINNGQYYISPVDPEEKRAVFDIGFNYPVNPETFEAGIQLKVTESDKADKWFTNRILKYKVNYNKYYTAAYIQSEVLPIPAENVRISLTVDKGYNSSLGGKPYDRKLESTVSVPGMSNYVSVTDVRLDNVRTEDYRLQQVFIMETKGEARVGDIARNLEMYVLPVDKPAQPGIPAAKNYHWSDVHIIDTAILNVSDRLTFAPQPTERDYAALTSCRLKIPERKFVYIRLKEGIPFYGGYKLPRTYEWILQVPAYPREISIMHDGSLLSASGGKKLGMMGYNIEEVEFTAGRLLHDQINHLVSQSNGNMTNIRFTNYNFDENNISEKKSYSTSLVVEDPGAPQYFSFDFTRLVEEKREPYGNNGIFFFKVTGRDRRYSFSVSDSRLVMITDLGILVKSNADKSRDVFVQSIATGAPVGFAQVDVIGKNGLPLVTRYTDSGGHVNIPEINSVREQSPVAYIITRGSDFSFLPYEGNGRWLDFTNFDTGGVYGKSDPALLSAYLFSDRGIYRPGDKINAGMIVRSTDWNRSLRGIPLEAAVKDSRGLEVYTRQLQLSPDGFEELSYQTENTSPTGSYYIELYQLNERNRRSFLGSVQVKVEEFLPDRLKLTTGFSVLPARGWIKPIDLKAEIKLVNLFGTPATDCRVNAQYRITQARFYFPAYRDYRFYDPYGEGNSYTEYLGTENTDTEGSCEFPLNLNQFGKATFRLSFQAEAFEKGGGRSVSGESSITVSPLDYIIGSKSESDLSYIYLNQEAAIDYISLNAETEPVKTGKLKFLLYEVTWVSVLTKLQNGTYKYQSVQKKELVSSVSLSIPAGGLKYPLPADKAGEFELVAADQDDTVLNRNSFSVISRENLARSLDKNAELKIKLSRDDFQAGEEIEIFIQAPYTGSGIITIERDKVYAYKWFTARSNSFTERIQVPADLEGNAYINVAYIRSPDSREIFMSPLSYGVANFSISRDKRTTRVNLTLPAEARPGQPLAIKYNTNKRSRIIVYAVDQGILQVAGYRTPDPLAFFFKKRALEVQTSQILDLILPEFSVVQSLAAMGGGGGEDEIALNLNPFKRKNKPPVVFWSGILDADENERTVTYDVPDYFNGTLHVFAVAVNSRSIGVAEETSTIHDYFVITPNLPLFAAPGDQFTATVTVANTLKGSGNKAQVTLVAETSEHLKADKGSFTLTVPEGKDAMASIAFTVNDILGAADIRFKAAYRTYASSVAESLSIRPPVPYITTLNTGYLKKESGEVPVTRRLYPHYRTKELALSFVPLGISRGLLQYLDNYPYGCSEQLVSRAFPYAALSRVAEFRLDFKQADTRIQDIIRILRSRQTADGAFGIWVANSFTSPFVNVYVLHFLTEAREAGFYVPSSVINNGLDYLKKYLGKEDTAYFEMETKAYAVYVLTRNEVITTPYIEKLINLYKTYNKGWEKQLSGLYLAASLQLLQDKERAEQIIKKFEVAQKKLENRNSFYNRYIQNAQFLYILSRHFKDQLKNVSDSLLDALTSAVEEGSYNTVVSSYTILGLTEYVKATDVLQNGKVAVTETDSSKQKTELAIPDSLFPVIPFSDNAVKLLLKNNEKLGLYYQVIEAGFDKKLPDKKKAEGIEVYKEFKDTGGRTVTGAELGEELMVHIKIRATGNTSYDDMVIADLVPGGFEPVLEQETGGDLDTTYYDRREDRMIVYCRVNRNLGTFIYKIKAVNPGTFSVPPVFAEHMYDKKIQAFTPFASALVVKDAPAR